jgi:hypothetical protein
LRYWILEAIKQLQVLLQLLSQRLVLQQPLFDLAKDDYAI